MTRVVSQDRAPILAGFYRRGRPEFSYMLGELGKHRSVRGYWCAEPKNIVRLALGRAHHDPNSPLPLPVLRRFKRQMLSLYGPFLDRAKACETVIFSETSHAALLPFFRHARKIYYVLDNYAFYGDASLEEEDEILNAADKIVVVSKAIGDVLAKRVPRIRSRLVISHNAVPQNWLPERCPDRPAPLPRIRTNERPLVGMLGNISSRLRLDWLLEAVHRLPDLHWLFAGEIEDGELTEADRPILAALKANPHCHFVGYVAYEDMVHYAKALDVALLPYSAQSINPYCCPMRLFMHLPFGQPIVATPGCAMLEEFGPSVTMCRSVEELVAVLADLHARDYDDGLREARWQLAHMHHWEYRAKELLPHLQPRQEEISPA